VPQPTAIPRAPKFENYSIVNFEQKRFPISDVRKYQGRKKGIFQLKSCFIAEFGYHGESFNFYSPCGLVSTGNLPTEIIHLYYRRAVVFCSPLIFQ
jgi:hypothetical protein